MVIEEMKNRREISICIKRKNREDGGGKMRSYVRTKDTKCPKNKLMIPCLLLILVITSCFIAKGANL